LATSDDAANDIKRGIERQVSRYLIDSENARAVSLAVRFREHGV